MLARHTPLRAKTPMRRTDYEFVGPFSRVPTAIVMRDDDNSLLTDSREKIYVTYGAAHLPGVMALMQREPGWKVESVKWMRTIAAPEHLEGRL